MIASNVAPFLKASQRAVKRMMYPNNDFFPIIHDIYSRSALRLQYLTNYFSLLTCYLGLFETFLATVFSHVLGFFHLIYP